MIKGTLSSCNRGIRGLFSATELGTVARTTEKSGVRTSTTLARKGGGASFARNEGNAVFQGIKTLTTRLSAAFVRATDMLVESRIAREFAHTSAIQGGASALPPGALPLTAGAVGLLGVNALRQNPSVFSFICSLEPEMEDDNLRILPAHERDPKEGRFVSPAFTPGLENTRAKPYTSPIPENTSLGTQSTKTELPITRVEANPKGRSLDERTKLFLENLHLYNAVEHSSVRAPWVKKAEIGDGIPRVNSVADALRLKVELTLREANILDTHGKLTEFALSDIKPFKRGDKLHNPAVIAELTKNGELMENWRKCTTRHPVYLPDGQHIQVHFYKNFVTGEINYNMDYKVTPTISKQSSNVRKPNR